jgi:hypothetical protein
MEILNGTRQKADVEQFTMHEAYIFLPEESGDVIYDIFSLSLYDDDLLLAQRTDAKDR